GAAVAATAKTKEKDAASRLNERADMNGLPSDGVEGKDRAIMAESIALAAMPFSFLRSVSPTPLTFRHQGLKRSNPDVLPALNQGGGGPILAAQGSGGVVEMNCVELAEARKIIDHHQVVSAPVVHREPATTATPADAARKSGAVVQDQASPRC